MIFATGGSFPQAIKSEGIIVKNATEILFMFPKILFPLPKWRNSSKFRLSKSNYFNRKFKNERRYPP
jgi:hypothetical protein